MNSYLFRLTLSSVMAALCYVVMLPMMLIPGLFLTLFICFAAGVALGKGWGFLTGIVGMFLCSFFNPLGSALLPIMIAQMLGAGIAGWLGGAVRRVVISGHPKYVRYILMGLFGLITALAYHLLVDITDAWLWGPFWVRLQIGLTYSLVTIASNVVIFIVLYPALDTLESLVKSRRVSATQDRSSFLNAHHTSDYDL
ncbi:MAG: hypothetical protein KKH67_13055 [candidate division Zixibacteria bacterium]|nr:hypothetical protein [candidate division Zixibacteria bacterium]MBU1471907.1 hypothetical protein [candidate division Zixibacteria bacterium]